MLKHSCLLLTILDSLYRRYCFKKMTQIRGWMHDALRQSNHKGHPKTMFWLIRNQSILVHINLKILQFFLTLNLPTSVTFKIALSSNLIHSWNIAGSWLMQKYRAVMRLLKASINHCGSRTIVSLNSSSLKKIHSLSNN
jgi:hypothetical protein